MTCFVQAIYTHMHDLFGTGYSYTYISPVWYRQFIHIYMTCWYRQYIIACTKQVLYMFINFLYQTGHVYVYKLPVPNRSCICVWIALTKQVMYMCITYTWPVWYRKCIHIYMTCLEKAIYTHIHHLLCTGNLYTYTWPVWSRQLIHIYIRWCICV
jgi:hypothetical protein